MTWAFMAAISGASKSPQVHVIPLTPQEQQIKQVLLDLVTKEDEAVVTGNKEVLQSVFPAHASAFQHALQREKYLKAWITARGLQITGVTVGLRTPAIRFITPHRVQIFGVVSEAYSLRLPGSKDSHRSLYDQFGLGIRHDYELVKDHGHWLIANDIFTDPLNQDSRLSHHAVPASGRIQRLAPPPASPEAAKTITYANTYCGAAPGCGNDRRYNPHYVSYNGEGGDCTNFVSQALKAAGFRMTPWWEYSVRRQEGSPAWVNAQRLKDFLDASGRATLYASGSYAQLTKPTPQYPHGAIDAIRPGDLISYIERGRAVHSALVVGYDHFGYPVVDSHTADRFQVPWDLGWDRHTIYNLWHVHYPPAPHAPSQRP